MSVPLPVVIATTAFVVVCWMTDVRTRRIPNALSGAALLIGIAGSVWFFGFSGGVWSVAGAVLAVALLLAPFALGGIGGGDVKMMAAVGALLGPRLLLLALSTGMILGGIIMIAYLVRRGRLVEKLASTRDMLLAAILARSLAPLKRSSGEIGAISLPYSVPLGLGALLAIGIAGILGGSL